QVMAADRDRPVPEPPDPRAEDDDRRERKPAADRVNDGRACEVEEADVAQPADRSRAVTRDGLAAPGPMTEHRIGDPRSERSQHEIAAEAHSLRDSPGHQGRRGSDEPELKDEEGADEGVVAAEQERGAPEQPVAGAEHEPEAEEPEQRRGDEEVREVL